MLLWCTRIKKGTRSLETGAVDDLHVDCELTTVVADHEDTNAAAAGLEGFVEAGPEVGLVDDGESLLDIAGLGHSDNWRGS